MPNEPQDFVDIIKRAQRVTPGDVATPFTGKDAFVNAPAGDDLAYEAHVKMFIMPPDAADYEDILNMMLRGEALLRYEDRTFTKEGDFQVALCWLTPRRRAAQAVNIAAGDAEPEVAPRRLP